jgi:peptidoglycan/LPS O-acetylase OafA/YrhL
LWPLQRETFWDDGVAASLYAINIWLSVTGTDYLTGGDPSLFQHYWSLAVEEQFYLVWPILVAFLVTRRHGATVAIPLMGIISFLLCVYFTAEQQPVAFFMPFTRAWEFLAGAALAWVTKGRDLSVPRPVLTAMSIAGMGTLIVSSFLIDATAPFPGFTALLPVVATCALLATKGGAFGPTLSTRPAQYLGNISYSLYLWHWPVLFIARAKLGDDLSFWASMALVLVSVALADLTHRFVETPLRTSSAFLIGDHPYRVAVAGTVVVAVVAASMMYVPNLKTGPTVLETQASGELSKGVPANINPPLGPAAVSDNPETYTNGCHLGIPGKTPRLDCVYGDRSASTKVALIGDSHAAHWLPGLHAAAKKHGIALYNFTKSGCPAADVTVWSKQLRRVYTECDIWREAVVDAVNELSITKVVVSDYRDYWLAGGEPLEDWAGSVLRTGARLGEASLVAIAPTPTFPYRPKFCLSGNLENAAACGRSRGELMNDELIDREKQSLVEAGVQYVDVNDWLCANDFCPVISGNSLIYIDSHHIAVPYSASLASRWESVLVTR